MRSAILAKMFHLLSSKQTQGFYFHVGKRPCKLKLMTQKFLIVHAHCKTEKEKKKISGIPKAPLRCKDESPWAGNWVKSWSGEEGWCSLWSQRKRKRKKVSSGKRKLIDASVSSQAQMACFWTQSCGNRRLFLKQKMEKERFVLCLSSCFTPSSPPASLRLSVRELEHLSERWHFLYRNLAP